MKKFVLILIWLLAVVGLIVGVVFLNSTHKDTVCNNVDIIIKYKSNDFFITTDDIQSYLVSNNIKIKGQKLADINQNNIESLLLKNPFIESAEVYVMLNGNLKITIVQKRPLARIINKFDQSYYIDDMGYLIPSSQNYSARVVVANGFIEDFYKPSVRLIAEDSLGKDSTLVRTPLYKIFKIAEYLNGNEFWKAQIDGIFIDSKGSIELFCKLGDFRILFGDIDNMDHKFENLFYFFRFGLNKIGWNRYKTINLKYNNQIVCSKF